MLKIEEIHELIKLIDESTIDEFTYENEGAKIKLKKIKKSFSKLHSTSGSCPSSSSSTSS